DAVPFQSLFGVIPPQSQPVPELWVKAVPVMIEAQDIATVMGSCREHACLGGQHGLVMRMRDIGIASPSIMALIDHGEGHASCKETIQVCVWRKAIRQWLVIHPCLVSRLLFLRLRFVLAAISVGRLTQPSRSL